MMEFLHFICAIFLCLLHSGRYFSGYLMANVGHQISTDFQTDYDHIALTICLLAGVVHSSRH